MLWSKIELVLPDLNFICHLVTLSRNAEDEEGSDGDENPDVDMNDDKENNAADAEDDENADTFGFERYEGEEGTQVAGIGDIAVIDPNEQLDDEDDDSEAEDDIIKPTDNLIIVGHVDDDCSELQVYGE